MTTVIVLAGQSICCKNQKFKKYQQTVNNHLDKKNNIKALTNYNISSHEHSIAFDLVPTKSPVLLLYYCRRIIF